MTNPNKLLDMVKVISDEEAAKGDFIICLPAHIPTRFTDNVFDNCFICNQKVQFRPDAPKLKPVCINCCSTLVEEQNSRPTFMVTETTAKTVKKELS